MLNPGPAAGAAPLGGADEFPSTDGEIEATGAEAAGDLAHCGLDTEVPRGATHGFNQMTIGRLQRPGIRRDGIDEGQIEDSGHLRHRRAARKAGQHRPAARLHSCRGLGKGGEIGPVSGYDDGAAACQIPQVGGSP